MSGGRWVRRTPSVSAVLASQARNLRSFFCAFLQIIGKPSRASEKKILQKSYLPHSRTPSVSLVLASQARNLRRFFCAFRKNYWSAFQQIIANALRLYPQINVPKDTKNHLCLQYWPNHFFSRPTRNLRRFFARSAIIIGWPSQTSKKKILQKS